jgi:thermolysin
VLSGALSALERDTGHPWSGRWHPSGGPAWLEGRTPPIARTAAQAERAGPAFLRRYPEIFGPLEEVTVETAVQDELGMIHVRLHQRRSDIPVWGSDLRLHFSAEGALVRLNGRLISVGDPLLVPVRSDEEARRSALLDAQSLRPELPGEVFSTIAPRLWLFPAPRARLAWRVEVQIDDGARPMRLETFVDADDGSILTRRDLLLTLSGSGVGVFGERHPLTITEKDGEFWLEDPGRGMQKTYSASERTNLPGIGVRSRDRDRWDLAGAAAGAAVDAHAYVARSWDWFWQRYGRAGWDGDDNGVHASVHFGQGLGNAFFDGRRLVFGDGNAAMSPPAGALDVVAHEYAHGVVLHTAGLGSQGQSGALHEAIADLFACFISLGAVPGGDWQIGETVYHPAGRLRPLRDLARPHATGQPAQLAEWDAGASVHHNSTIVSHAGHLMSEALGAERAAQIWYRALTRYLTSEADFTDAADATMAAAADFARGEESTVRAAWAAVGVYNATP